MLDNIQNPIRRTQAYWYRDGLSELCMGVLLFLIGMVLLVEGPAIRGSNLALVLPSIRYVLLIGGVIGIGFALRFFKKNLVYPRSGYVIYAKPTFNEILPGLISVMVLNFLLETWIQEDMQLKLTLHGWLLTGLTVFFAYLFISWRLATGFVRFYFLALLTFLSGLVIALLGIRHALQENYVFLLAGPGFFFGVLGLVLCISGSIALWNYLRQSPNPSGESV